MFLCIDCGKKISFGHKRCLKCWHKFAIAENAANFKQGNTLKTYYCIDCEKLISRHSTGRCRSCSAKERIKVKGNPNLKHGETLKKHYCMDCKTKEINYNTWKNGTQRCSSCAKKELYKDPRNHPNWQEGSSSVPYPLEFNESLKESIRKRDNYQCQNTECNMTEEEHIIVLGRNLSIHHIDYNKQNCNEENLITLCNQCNIRANVNRDYWINFYQKILKRKI